MAYSKQENSNSNYGKGRLKSAQNYGEGFRRTQLTNTYKLFDPEICNRRKQGNYNGLHRGHSIYNQHVLYENRIFIIKIRKIRYPVDQKKTFFHENEIFHTFASITVK